MANIFNTDTSIVDYLKSQGKDSSMSARKELASSLGFTNYSGGYDDNVKLLNILKGSSDTGSNGSKPTASNTGGSNTGGGTGSGSTGGGFTQSGNTTNAQSVADAYRDKVVELSNQTDIIDQSTKDALNTPLTLSSAYMEALNYTNSLREKLNSGRTSYTDRINEMMDKIQNRDEFSYDVESDMLFQQSLASAMASGKTAMQDTIGQASALTGGYGSTYATSAGNQAYNAYIQDAYENLPEYYQMAMEAYQMEGQEMYNQLGMLKDADATEYGRLYDAWNVNYTTTQDMYNREYGAWQDSINNAYNSANLQLKEHGQIFDQTYNTYNALQDNANTQYAREYQKWSDEVNNALKQAQLLEEKRQYDESLKEEQRQFDARDINGDGKVDTKDEAVEYDRVSDSQKATLQKIWYEKGGTSGDEESVKQASEAVLNQLSLWGLDNVDMEALDSVLGDYTPEVWEANWDMSNDTKNGWWIFGKGEDHNDEYTATIGGEKVTMTYDELKEAINKSPLSDIEKNKLLKKLQDLSTR